MINQYLSTDSAITTSTTTTTTSTEFKLYFFAYLLNFTKFPWQHHN